MLTLPAPVLNYLLKTTVADRTPAYLCVSQEGQLNQWGGHLSAYGIVDLQPGQPIDTQVVFLEGLLPLDGSELFLPHLQIDAGRCADIYLFSDAACDWVLLLDATADTLQTELLQQCRNHINLLQNAQSQLISRSLQSSQPAPALLTPLFQETCQPLTLLFADLRGLTPPSDQHPPDRAFQMLNLYLRQLIQAIVSEAGLVDRLRSDAVTACFGVLPALATAPTHAIRAGLKILTTVGQINHLRQAQQQPVFNVGIGIASGATALGLLGDRHHRTMGAIGYPVNLAAALQQQANPGEILIDENTFNQAVQMQPHFATVDRLILHLSEPVKVYSTSGSGNE